MARSMQRPILKHFDPLAVLYSMAIRARRRITRSAEVGHATAIDLICGTAPAKATARAMISRERSSSSRVSKPAGRRDGSSRPAVHASQCFPHEQSNRLVDQRLIETCTRDEDGGRPLLRTLEIRVERKNATHVVWPMRTMGAISGPPPEKYHSAILSASTLSSAA